MEYLHIAPEIRIKLKHIIAEQIYLNIPFFPYTIVEWNKLDNTIRNSKSFLIFRNSLLKIGKPIQNSIFKIHDPLGIKLLTRLRLGHLNEHRFRHNLFFVIISWCWTKIQIFV